MPFRIKVQDVMGKLFTTNVKAKSKILYIGVLLKQNFDGLAKLVVS